MPDRKRHRNLPRLPRRAYQGLARVHWILNVRDRKKGWLNHGFYRDFREILLHSESRYHLISPAYCVMPDHIHLLWMGVSHAADQTVAIEFFAKHLKPFLGAFEFQKPPFDHVLREHESKQDAFQNAAHYILDNPVRAGLVDARGKYTYSGACIPGYPDLDVHSPDYWDLFWRIYHRLAPHPDSAWMRPGQQGGEES